MRAVALADLDVQAVINSHFVPLKVEMVKGQPKFPLEWKALKSAQAAYKINLFGEEKKGFTMCTVVTPDLGMELANTGSAFVWQLFDSIAYDRDRFLKMVQNANSRAIERENLLAAIDAGVKGSRLRYQVWKRKVEREIRVAGRFGLPPKGFTAEKAAELFRMTGDLK